MNLFRRLVVSLGLLVAVILAGTIGYRVIVTDAGWLDSLYMTVITLSTVGYGEVVPGLEQSVGGRIFTIVLILAGMGILLHVVSTTTAFFVEGELTDILRRRKMEKKIAGLEGHTIVCGVGFTGEHVVKELLQVGDRFVVIENNDEMLERALEKYEFLYLKGDATEESVLSKAGVERAKGIVSVLSGDKDNLVVTCIARSLNPHARIIARTAETSSRERLRSVGADAVVCPSQIGGLRIASELLRPHVVGFLDRMLRHSDATWRFEEVPVAPSAVGKRLDSLRIPETTGLPVLAISESDGGEIRYYPTPDTILTADSRLVVLAERGQIAELRKLTGA